MMAVFPCCMMSEVHHLPVFLSHLAQNMPTLPSQLFLAINMLLPCSYAFVSSLYAMNFFGKLQGSYGSLKVLKSLEIFEFYKVVLKSLEFNCGQ